MYYSIYGVNTQILFYILIDIFQPYELGNLSFYLFVITKKSFPDKL